MATETKTVKPQEGYGTRFWNWLTETQVWTSVFRHERPDTDRNRVLVMLSNVFLHLHPVRIRKSGVKLRYTWCMGGLSFFLFLVADVHRPAADVLLPADARVRLQRHRRAARARAARHHARDAPLGRPRDGHHGVAAHVPRVHDRLVQAAARVQLEHRRHHARAHAAAVVHGLPAAVGSAGDLGHHGRLEHGARDTVPRATKARAPRCWRSAT